MRSTVWKAIRCLLLPLLAVVLAGCAGSGGSPSQGGAGPAAGPPISVTAQQCKAVAAAAPVPHAETLGLVIDRTKSGLARALPPAATDALQQAQKAGWNLAVVSVNGSGANPIVAPLIALDPQQGVESPDADRARAAALACLPGELDRSTLAPTAAGSDILAAVAAAGRQRPEELLVVSDGVSNAGGLNIAQIGYDANADAIAAQLANTAQLPDLHPVPRTIWSDLGETTTPLPQPARTGLQALWQATLKAAGTAVSFDSRVQVTDGAQNAFAIAPVQTLADPIPALKAAIVNSGNVVCLTLPNGILFAPDSAEISNATPLKPIATALAAHPSWAAVIVGHTADYGPPDGQVALSRQRAAAVAALIRSLGAPAATSLEVRGVGSTQPIAAEWHDGIHDATAAAKNRRVVIRYGTPAALSTATCP